MAVELNKVGNHVEVKFDSSTPDIMHQSCFRFDKVGSTGIKIYAGKSIGKIFTWSNIAIGGITVSDYDDFKIKLATVFNSAAETALPTPFDFMTFKLSQEGFGDPVLLAVSSAINGHAFPLFTYAAEGVYIGSIGEGFAFPSNKTMIIPEQRFGNRLITARFESDTEVIVTSENDFGIGADNLLDNNQFVIIKSND